VSTLIQGRHPDFDAVDAQSLHAERVTERAGAPPPGLIARGPCSKVAGAVILGSEERQPLMDDDRPLPFELPAAALR
jgi:hypothetical protein